MRIVPIGVDERGEIDIEELKAKATEHKDKCAVVHPLSCPPYLSRNPLDHACSGGNVF